MLYISVQPDIHYFHWQIKVMLINFKEVGINMKNVHVIFLYLEESKSKQGDQLISEFPDVKFFFYKDERIDRSYIPSIKPYGMYRHLKENKIKKTIFYHDSDIIFREKIREDFFDEKNICYMSNTISYIGYDYCVSKGLEQLQGMADVVKVPLEVIKENQSSSGGAQYIISNSNYFYWHKVYEDSIKLYKYLDSRSKIDVPKEGDYLIQKWCAEMWATLWNLWIFDYETRVHKELDFCFATAPVGDYFQNKILHNAGVTVKDKDKMFFKGEFINKSPFEVDLSYVSDQYCSYKYKEAVEKVEISI